MKEKTFLVTAFVDAEFEMFRVAKLVDGKPADTVKYFKSGDELINYLRNNQ